MQVLKAFLISTIFIVSCLNAELKDSFSYKDRIQLFKMSTFGPTAEMLEDFNSSYSNDLVVDEIEWLDEQLNFPSAYDDPDDNWTTHFQRTKQIAETLTPSIDFYEDRNGDGLEIFNRVTAEPNISNYQMSAWWENVIGNKTVANSLGSDQLRQRTAYAFSQLLVVSRSAPPLNRRAEGLACYYDILCENAFGNYEELLREIMRSPAMGVFLSSAFNKKASLKANTRPDENLAREFLQLFTIGPYELNLDGSVKIDENGGVVPSYTQNDIMEMAKILTGWILYGSKRWSSAGQYVGSYTDLMIFNSDNHEYELDDFYTTDEDRGTITLFKGKPMETSVDLNATDDIPDGNDKNTSSGLDAAINVVFNHPNVGPFIAKHLIKHFVTSNPTPGYIERIARVFNDDGNGERGNLKAVIKAILLDKEAYNQSIEVGGKVKEPLLAFCQFLRAMEARPWPKTKSNRASDHETNPPYLGPILSYPAPENTLNQAALRSLDVFNFYSPNFTPPDDNLMNYQIISQESEILNDNYFPNLQNILMKIISNYRNKRLLCVDPHNLTGDENAPEMNYWEPNFSIDLKGPLNTLALGFGVESGKFEDLKSSHFDDVNQSEEAVYELLDWYEDNLLFCDLDDDFRSAFVDLSINGLNRWQYQSDDEGGKSRALSIVENTLLLIVLSPDFMVDAGSVPDITPPVIELLGDSNVSISYGEMYVEPGFRSSDNVYAGQIDSRVVIEGDVNPNEEGTYVISYSVVDAAGNVSETVKRTVVVTGNTRQVDKVPPEIHLLGSANVQVPVDSEYVDAGVTAIDNEDGNLSSAIVMTGQVNTSVPGTYELNFSVTDSAGNASNSVTRTVVVVKPEDDSDIEAPNLMLFGNSVVNLYLGDSYVELGFQAIDNIDGDITSLVEISGEVNSLDSGTYELLYSVKDEAGNSSGTLKRIVVVSEVDRVPPKLVLHGSQTLSMMIGESFTEPGFDAIDNKDGNLTSEVSVTGDINSSKPGTYDLSYVVSDEAGNLSEQIKRKVIVLSDSNGDSIPPVIQLNGTEILQIIEGSLYIEPGFVAHDNMDGDITNQVLVSGEVDSSKSGNYSLFYSVTDQAGNMSDLLKRTVIVSSSVTDNVRPQLVLFGPSISYLMINEFYFEPGYQAFDDQDGDITSKVELMGYVNSSKEGEYELKYSVKDSSGNSSGTFKRLIKVSPFDMVSPKLSLRGSSVISLALGESFLDPGFEANDNKDGNVTSSVVVEGEVITSKEGTYMLSYSVKDDAGNISEVLTRTVVVVETIPEDKPSYWWSNSSSIGNGFYKGWLGQFMPFESGWIYHLDFGWVYVVESDIQGLWLWIDGEGWIWTNEKIWPHMWSNKTGYWLYFTNLNSYNYFFDHFTRKFREIAR